MILSIPRRRSIVHTILIIGAVWLTAGFVVAVAAGKLIKAGGSTR